MELSNFIYRSDRIGKNGKVFSLYKIRTMRPVKTSFVEKEHYTRFGRLLRKTKADELPQLLNWLKGDLTLVGPRADFQESWELVPKEMRKKILSIKPGLTSLSSVFFHDEEMLLNRIGEDKFKTYYGQIKPAKILLDTFYVEHRCWILDLAILYMTAKVMVKSVFNK